jgi:hypothetical protein
MLLANYASDSDSDHEDAGPSRPAPIAATPVKPKRKAPVKITLDLPKSSTTNDQPEGDEDEERDSKKAKTTGPKGGKGSYVTPSSL